MVRSDHVSTPAELSDFIEAAGLLSYDPAAITRIYAGHPQRLLRRLWQTLVPIGLYLLAVALPKQRLVATAAWFFLILNVTKIPLSASLGLISLESLAIDALLAPCVLAGLVAGRAIVKRIPQKLFDTLLLLFTGVAALRLMLG